MVIDVDDDRYLTDDGTGLADARQVAAIKDERHIIRFDIFDIG